MHTKIFKNEDNNSNIYSGMLFGNCIKIKYANPVQQPWLIVSDSYHWDLTMLALFARNIGYVMLFSLKQTCRTPAERLLGLLYVFPPHSPFMYQSSVLPLCVTTFGNKVFMGVTKARWVDKDRVLGHWICKRKTEGHKEKTTSCCENTRWPFTHTPGTKVLPDTSLGIWTLNF